VSSFVLQRLLSFFVTLAVTSIVVFGVLEWLPGNAAQVILGETATSESNQLSRVICNGLAVCCKANQV
jgi:peptide/nickel transport system permease protein